MESSKTGCDDDDALGRDLTFDDLVVPDPRAAIKTEPKASLPLHQPRQAFSMPAELAEDLDVDGPESRKRAAAAVHYTSCVYDSSMRSQIRAFEIHIRLAVSVLTPNGVLVVQGPSSLNTSAVIAFEDMLEDLELKWSAAPVLTAFKNDSVMVYRIRSKP